MTSITKIEEYSDGIVVFCLKSEDLEVHVSNYGGHLLAVKMKDKDENIDDVVLGFDDIEGYKTQDKYIGALVGRVANRIKHGQFYLNQKAYTLAINNGPNHLHGGLEGFDTKVFDYQIKGDTLVLTYVSLDNEEGYPGQLTLTASYQLQKETLTLYYHATSSEDTLINITNHSYFNLSGMKENVYEHTLQIKSDQFMAVDKDGCPTGEYIDVKETPFDFNLESEMGKNIKQNHPQLILGNGFDHPYILTKDKDQIILRHPKTKRKLTVSTSLPCVQIYTANYLDGKLIGKNLQAYQARDGICLETQFIPDDIHLSKEPKTILRKGESYDVATSYCFEVE